MADKLLARAAEWPAGTKPALRLLLNGSVQVVDEVEDAPLLTITGHNGVNPAVILHRLAAATTLYEALEAAEGHLTETLGDKRWHPIGQCPVLDKVRAALKLARGEG